MIKHFCDICGKELDEKQKLRYKISFQFDDDNQVYQEFCDGCSEQIANHFVDMIYKYKR